MTANKFLGFFRYTMLILGLVGCSSPQIKDYQAQKPTFDLQKVFQGPLKAHGVVRDRKGQVLRTFDCDILATWNGNVGTLDETFYWSDGEVQKRVWTLNKLDAESFTGTAGDVIGTAQGQTSGNALRMQYTLRIPFRGDTLDLRIDDWMFLTDQGVVINRSEMTKFGFRVGEVILTIIPSQATK